MLRQRFTHCHQEDGPVNGVETQDVLTNQMQIGRPVFLIIFAVVAVSVKAKTGDIVGQSVQPNVYNVSIVEVHGDAPLEGSSRNAKVLQALLQEVVHHFIFTGNGLNEFGMLFDMFYQTIRILAHLEEVSFFLGRFYISTAVGALAVHQLTLRPKRFAGSTIHPYVFTLIDVALFVEFLKNLRYLSAMFGVGRTHKLIVRSAHHVPNVFDGTSHVIDKRLGRYAGCRRFFFNFLAVFVRTRLEEYVIALLALKTSNRISQNRFIGIPDMGFPGSVCNCGGDIIFLVCHKYSLHRVAFSQKEFPFAPD